MIGLQPNLPYSQLQQPISTSFTWIEMVIFRTPRSCFLLNQQSSVKLQQQWMQHQKLSDWIWLKSQSWQPPSLEAPFSRSANSNDGAQQHPTSPALEGKGALRGKWGCENLSKPQHKTHEAQLHKLGITDFMLLNQLQISTCTKCPDHHLYICR